MRTEFNRYAVKANEMLGMLAEELQITPDKALRLLRCVLHVLRDHMSIQESMQFIAQLPIIIKGIYVEQWNAQTQQRRIHTLEEFLNEVRDHDDWVADYDFESDESTAKIVRAVFKTLYFYVSEGEFEDVIAIMPLPIKKFISDSMGKGKMTM